MTIALVGEISAANYTTSPITVPSSWISGAGGDIPVGTLLVARLSMVSVGAGTFAATDSAVGGSNTWIAASSIYSSGGTNEYCTLWSLLTTKLRGGTDTIAFTRNGSTVSTMPHQVQLTAFSGVTATLDGTGGTATGVDQKAAGGGTVWTSASGSGLVTANANDLLIGGTAYLSGAQRTQSSLPAGFSDETQSGIYDSSNGISLFTEYPIVSATGTYHAGGTSSSSYTGYSAQLVVLQAATGTTPQAVSPSASGSSSAASSLSQAIRPDADISTGSWATAPLWSATQRQ